MKRTPAQGEVMITVYRRNNPRKSYHVMDVAEEGDFILCKPIKGLFRLKRWIHCSKVWASFPMIRIEQENPQLWLALRG